VSFIAGSTAKTKVAGASILKTPKLNTNKTQNNQTKSEKSNENHKKIEKTISIESAESEVHVPLKGQQAESRKVLGKKGRAPQPPTNTSSVKSYGVKPEKEDNSIKVSIEDKLEVAADDDDEEIEEEEESKEESGYDSDQTSSQKSRDSNTKLFEHRGNNSPESLPL
jgi:hypothetical protein